MRTSAAAGFAQTNSAVASSIVPTVRISQPSRA
jgi:hypothetical protein